MRGNKDILELYINNQSKLCAYAHSFIGDYDTCKDIVQDVFLNLCENDFFHIEKANNKSGYLYTCVRNKCLDHIKGKNVRERYLSRILNELSQVDDSAVSDYEVTELSRILEKAISSLHSPTCSIFFKSRIEGKKNAEIAEEMGISIKTVEAHITKALKRIRQAVASLSVIVLIIFTITRIL